MARTPRIFQKLFGSTGTTVQFGKFGSIAAGLPANTKDPTLIQSLSNFLDGWYAAIIGNNAPAIQDMNALFFLAYYQLTYLFESGVPEWDAETTYYIGNIVNVGGILYVSVTDTNLNNAVTVVANWKLYGSNLTQIADANYTTLFADQMIEIAATTAERTVTMLAAAAGKFKKQTITKTDASANEVVISGAAVPIRLKAQYDSVTLFSNGGVWYEV